MSLCLPVLLVELLAASGLLYTLVAIVVAGGWRETPPPASLQPAVTILKPLHGDEPRLEANLQGFLDQRYGADVQMICGAQDAADSAIGPVRALEKRGAAIELQIDSHTLGTNAKVANLANLVRHARHDLLVLSDSDIAVGRDYLAQLAAAMSVPGVGAVTCLYAGRGDAGHWSQLAAAGISYQFLPSVMVGLALGRARPCMGSTIALRRDTLRQIGGFERFADTLADDHAIGAAVRALGLTVALPPMILFHGCAETSLRALVRHELRWNATVRGLDPWGFAGSLATHPLPLALFACLGGDGRRSAILALAILAARLALATRIDRLTGRHSAPLWLLPLRDLLSFGLFVATFFVRSVDWRGARFRLAGDGRISAEVE